MSYNDFSEKERGVEALNLLKKISKNTEGGGEGFRTLTQADYDYPAGSPDRVALWNLEAAYYVIDGENVKIQFGESDNHPITLDTGDIVIAIGGGDIIYTQRKNNDFGFYAGNELSASILTLAQTQDNLGSSSTVLPLSANQGRVLNEKIEALTARVAALENA